MVFTVPVRRPALRIPLSQAGLPMVAALANTDAGVALHGAEPLRQAVEDRALPHPHGVVTVRLGATSPVPAPDASTPGAEALLEAAAAALDGAKQGGASGL